MKRRHYVAMGVVFSVVIGICPWSLAQVDLPFCTDTPAHCQTKVAQVPLPFQFWAFDADGNLIDRIRISPTWENPPGNLPPGAGPIIVNRQVAVIPLTTGQVPELEDLVWDFENNSPGLDLRWEPVPGDPQEVKLGEDLEYVFPADVAADAAAVIVAYEVSNEGEVTGHFLNEAVLGRDDNPGIFIAEVRVNFDIHNATDFQPTNFELDFDGLDFTCDDIIHALGFVAGHGIPPAPTPGGPWGANEDNPLVVRPIEGGTEVKWVQPDTPLQNCDWLHIGLSFAVDDLIEGIDATVQGYWTTIGDCPPEVACVETVNPHGRKVPPAGSTTLPGPKGGQNEDGFYELQAIDELDPSPAIFVLDTGSGTVFGPYLNGDKIKYTEASGAKPGAKNIGSAKGQAGAVLVHITGTGDAAVFAIDDAGNQSASVSCLVPPPLK